MFCKLKKILKDYLENPTTDKKTPKFILLVSLRNINKCIWRYHSNFSEFVYDTFRGPSHFYYKWFYRKKILSSKPIICAKESEWEVHVLTCKRDFLNALWSLKSFFYYSGLRPSLIIHDDGTLEKKHARVLSKHFINCTVVMKKESDAKMKRFLGKYEYCARYRFEFTPLLAIKLFDFFFYSRNSKVVMIDSDVLFFGKAREISMCLTSDKGFFLTDCVDNYSVPGSVIKNLMGIEIMPRVNTGLVYFPGKVGYDLELFEELINKIYNFKGNVNLFFTEQTMFAALFSKHKERFIRLEDSYQLSNQHITNKTVCCHFIAGLGNNFYSKGLKRLKKQQFLKNLSLLKDCN